MQPRIVVVGAGHLGNYHLAKLAAQPACQLVALVEPNEERRAAAAARYGVPTYASLKACTIVADAAIIATPTSDHVAVAEAALAQGWDILVEKPLARTHAAALPLVQAAAAAGRLLQVGHVERFNPAVEAAVEALAQDPPRYIVAERLGPFSGRSVDVDVILDLMIHDLDLVAALVPAELVEVRAIGMPVLTDAIDMASARLRFADGTVAQLSAGRASFDASRKLRFFCARRYMSVDCAQREVKSVVRVPGSGDWPEISGESLPVRNSDPLAAQDADFIRCVRDRQPPRIDGQAALRALHLAERVKAAIAEAAAQQG